MYLKISLYLTFLYAHKKCHKSETWIIQNTLCSSRSPKYIKCIHILQDFSLLWVVMLLKVSPSHFASGYILDALEQHKIVRGRHHYAYCTMNIHTQSFHLWMYQNHNKTQVANLLNENSSAKEKQHLLKICLMLRILNKVLRTFQDSFMTLFSYGDNVDSWRIVIIQNIQKMCRNLFSFFFIL